MEAPERCRKMGKQENIIQGRNEGMAYALRIAEQDGIEALRADLERRNILGLKLQIPKKQLDLASNRIKEQTVNRVMIMAAMVLRDEFEFGGKRLGRFIERFNLKTACMVEGMISWEDMRDTIYEETGVYIELSHANE